MSGSVNKVILIGHCGKDPEIRTMQSGAKIANLSIATSESWRDKATGERKDRVEWHRVVVFNEHLVKIVEQYVKKGSRLFLEGALQTRKWTDQSGAEKYSTEIVIQGFNGSITLLDGPPSKSSETEGNYGFGASEPGKTATVSRPPNRQGFDEEIPF